MSNHYHVVLHVNKDRADGWPENEVVERWLKNPATLSSVELDKVSEIIELWRERLYDMSWFMRGTNEKIARMANEEENCKGRYHKNTSMRFTLTGRLIRRSKVFPILLWEGRFKSQAPL